MNNISQNQEQNQNENQDQNRNQSQDQELLIRTSMLYRNVVANSAVSEDRRFDLSFSSEQPVERYFGIEILDHREDSVKLDWLTSGRAPLLLDHDPTKQIGVVEQASIINGKARATIRFGKSKLAQNAFMDVKDGIKSNISVGYRYLDGGVILEQEGKDSQPNIYRINKWEPLEISLVSIPADHTACIARLKGEQVFKVITTRKNMGTNTATNMRTDMETNMGTNMGTNMETNIETNMQTETTNNIEQNNQNNATNSGLNMKEMKEIKEMKASIRNTEKARITEILALGNIHNMSTLANEFVSNGRDLDEFRQRVIEHLAKKPSINTISPTNAIIGMSQKETRSFSILRAIKAAATGSWNGAEAEKEASDEVAKKIGREAASFFVPLDVSLEEMRYNVDRSHRGLEKLNNNNGGYLVGTDYLSSSFIDLMRNKMLVRQMGAKVMSGLVGDIAIPKQTGGATSFWVTEGMAPTHSQQSFGQVTLSPKSIAAYTDFSRKLVLQSSPDIEHLVRADLASVIALEIDRAAINGSGKSPEPLGILKTPGISTVPITDANSISWGKIVDLESKISSMNADVGSLGYLCNANMRGVLKQTEKSKNTAQFIFEDGVESGFGYMNGYKVGTTNQMPADTIIFGNFGDLIIGQWGVLDVLVDPYALGTSGGIRIRLMQDVDVAVRHLESFACVRKELK